MGSQTTVGITVLILAMARVLHVITGLRNAGAERTLYNLLRGGLGQAFESRVVSLGDRGVMGPVIEELGVPLTALNMRGGRPSVSGLTELRRVVRTFRPHLIQGWMYHGNIAATVAARFARTRVNVAWNVRQTLYALSRDKPLTRVVIRLNRLASRSPGVVIYNSRLARHQHEEFGFARAKGTVIPNGVDTLKYRFSRSSRKRIRGALGIPTDAAVLGHVARFHPMKGHATFLAAAAKLAAKEETLYVLLSGSGVSADNDILTAAVPPGLRARFHFLGERTDVAELMSAMDLFCVSSAWGEGFSNVLGEAMAVGLPCVATDIGDSAAIIGDAGRVVAPEDEEALGESISSLLALPDEERRALGTHARARIEARFALESAVERYTALYTQLTNDKPG